MSDINLTNIDAAFPIAGQDNDSQGFRDNFYNTVDNFDIAKTEITALETLTELQDAPANSTGAAGDLKGMVAADASYIYVCIADYVQGTGDNIWVRTSASNVF